MKQKFKECSLGRKSLQMLEQVNDILEKYVNQGYTLTLRQLYYQLVSRNIIPNDDRQYKKLSRILGEGRLAGIVDWEGIEDRLRQVRKLPTWNSPEEILLSAANQYRTDLQEGQNFYLEVWVEKDALSQVVQRAANKYQVPVMVNRGYGSISMMYDAYQRFLGKSQEGKQHIIIGYLGDHDPSGLDMIRDVEQRVFELLNADKWWKRANVSYSVQHIALTQEQINQYNPPPNPAKLSDTRAADYIAKYGPVSWEVDALEPKVLNDLIIDFIEGRFDLDLYESNRQEMEDQREAMKEHISNIDF